MSFFRFVAALAACLVLGAPLSAQVINDRQPGASDLQIHSSSVTGLATLITGPGGLAIPAIENLEDPLAILDIHGRLFGLSDPRTQLRRMRTDMCDQENLHHRFQQVYRGIDVFTGQLIIHQDSQGQFLAVNGDYYPIRGNVPTQPVVTLEEAIFLAGGELRIEQPQASEEYLTIVDPGWYGDPSDGTIHLAWHMVVGSETVLPEHILIDAVDGTMVDHWPAVHSAINRRIYDGSGGGLPGTLVRPEGAAATGDADVDGVYDYTGDFYRLLNSGLGRDSLNGAGIELRATANWNDAICPNAIWNGSGTAYCDGLATDDIVGHEFGHGLTDHSADLIYQNQSGQLNESFSDVFGELVDLWNGDASVAGAPGGTPWPTTPTGGGTDTPNTGRSGCGDGSVRWLMGEDSSFGAIRDMWSPTCMGDPDRALSALYEATSCDPGFDSGGVHFGSGVPNHAFAMTTDGKTFNGVTVSGIGAIKAGAVWFRALTVYLTPASDFNEAYILFNQAATDLVGTTPNDPRTGGSSGSAFTAADATEVQNALIAVEMNGAGICNPPPPPPNDDCVDATVVAAGTHAIENGGATNSGVVATDAQCVGTFLGQVSKDIWLSYTPAQDGTATFTTCNIASWDTDLVIYTGGCGALNQVACNGDAAGCSNYTSIISNLAVTGGTEYLVRIGSWATTGGSGEIEIIFTPGGGTPVEVCNNGVDDDGDGAIDCADPDCVADPACVGSPIENCSNGVDDDGDGAIDCADPDCAGDPACIPFPADECATAEVAGLGLNLVNTIGASDSADSVGPCVGSFVGLMSNDVWYSLQVPGTGVLTVSTCGLLTYDSSLIVYQGSCGALVQVACNGDACGLDAELQLSVTVGDQLTIRLGAASAGQAGSGLLLIELVAAQPEDCSNGIDDDLDGLTDCLDPDCAADPSCTCDPIQALVCNQATGLEVELSWVNGEVYDQIEVVRDGTLLAILGGNETSYSDPTSLVGSRTYVVTGVCSQNQSSAICQVDVQQPAGFRFIAPQVNAEFDEATGVGSLVANLSIGEEDDNPGFPNATQGFSMSLASDPATLSVVSLTPAPILTAMNNSSGPDFMTETIMADGVTVGVVYSFVGAEVLPFASDTEVVIVGYDTNAGNLAGVSTPVATTLEWSETIGSTPVENLVVVNGAAYYPETTDGTVILTPTSAGGFDRGDCNIDGGFNIADIVHALNTLFLGGTFVCADACDINDDGLMNIADAVYGLADLFSDGDSPPPPHGSCGADPTVDALDCESYDVCS